MSWWLLTDAWLWIPPLPPWVETEGQSRSDVHPFGIRLWALEALPRLVCALSKLRCAPKNFMGE